VKTAPLPLARLTGAVAVALLGGRLAGLAAPAAPIKLDLDATDAPRRILHARLEFPVSPGPLTLVYPKWVPGEHAPSGDISDLAGLKFTCGGRAVDWRRDPDDMFAFHLDVPAGAGTLEARLDFLMPPGSATAKLADLSWNDVVLYPQGRRAGELQYAPTLRLPPGWRFGTALRPAPDPGGLIRFEPVSLETLVDSPVIAGAHFRTEALTPGRTPPHFLHVVADSPEALEFTPEDRAHYARLVDEAGALFGARHYGAYHFLLTLSDHVGHFGLEHHESSDNRQAERLFLDPDLRKQGAGLLPHEMTHSWNGKYRRPAGLATPDFQQPMQGELLWIYEGLTTYYGRVLSVRSGLWTPEDFRQALALDAARLDRAPGRTWRPLADTAVAAQTLYGARKEGSSWRRGTDFYPEGALIWLEADTLIRRQTQGRRSLDDFCRQFCGGQDGPPRVVPYTFDDVVAALDQVAPYDWRGFFQARVYAANPRAPLGGLTNAGWRLAYTNAPSPMLKSAESARKYTDLSFSLGLALKPDGTIQDVIPGSPADRAGLSPGPKLLAVNGRRWSPETLRRAAAAAATNSAPIELLCEDDDFFRTCKVAEPAGDRYPWLERDAKAPDLLGDILKPRAAGP
jgi:predicted metalloprotease with PDZ domain